MPFPTVEPDFDALRHALSQARADRGWTYDKLAELSGISRRTIISIESGHSHGSLRAWYKLAQAFDLELGVLLSAIGGPGKPGR